MGLKRKGDKTPGAIPRRGFKDKVAQPGGTLSPSQIIPRCPSHRSCSGSAAQTSPKHPPELPPGPPEMENPPFPVPSASWEGEEQHPELILEQRTPAFLGIHHQGTPVWENPHGKPAPTTSQVPGGISPVPILGMDLGRAIGAVPGHAREKGEKRMST